MLVQVLLIGAILAVALLLLRGQGARHLAIRRLLLLMFVGFAIVSVLFPDMWNALARAFGVGRGTDLLLYGLIVAFMGYVVTSYLRFREMELRLTRLARRIALDESPRPEGAPPLPGSPTGHKQAPAE